LAPVVSHTPLTPAHEVVGSGPPVALVPGTFSDRRAWLRVLGALSPSFRCVQFDPRGTGATPDPGTPFTPDDLVEDLVAVLDAARVGRCHLVGHSLGAAVALLAAARHPSRVGRVVAVAPAFYVDAYLSAVLDHWEALARSDLPAGAVHRGLLLPAFGPRAFERLVPALAEELDRRPLDRATILRYVACDRAQDLRAAAPRVDAAVLVVAGAADVLTGPVHAWAVADAIPGAEVEVLADCGHTPQVERPAELSRLLISFLRR